MHAAAHDDELIAAINVTPLVDVVLVLLVVSSVTASYVARSTATRRRRRRDRRPSRRRDRALRRSRARGPALTHGARVAHVLDDPPRIALGPGSRQSPLTRFGLIGDVHAEDERLETAITLARDRGAEALLCVGDVSDGFGDLDRTIAILERERVHVVRGNHDRWLATDTMRTLGPPVQLRVDHPSAEAAIRLWPPVLEVETIHGPLLLCHAVGDDDFSVIKPHTRDDEVREMLAWQQLVRLGRHRFMAAGHTHDPMVRTLDGITILNPGTLKRDKGPVTTFVDLAKGEMHVFDLERIDRPTLADVITVATAGAPG